MRRQAEGPSFNEQLHYRNQLETRRSEQYAPDRFNMIRAGSIPSFDSLKTRNVWTENDTLASNFKSPNSEQRYVGAPLKANTMSFHRPWTHSTRNYTSPSSAPKSKDFQSGRQYRRASARGTPGTRRPASPLTGNNRADRTTTPPATYLDDRRSLPVISSDDLRQMTGDDPFRAHGTLAPPTVGQRESFHPRAHSPRLMPEGTIIAPPQSTVAAAQEPLHCFSHQASGGSAAVLSSAIAAGVSTDMARPLGANGMGVDPQRPLGANADNAVRVTIAPADDDVSAVRPAAHTLPPRSPLRQASPPLRSPRSPIAQPLRSPTAADSAAAGDASSDDTRLLELPVQQPRSLMAQPPRSPTAAASAVAVQQSAVGGGTNSEDHSARMILLRLHHELKRARVVDWDFMRNADSDRSDTLTSAELRDAMLRHRIDVSDEDARAVFNLIDDDHSGRVSFNELKHALKLGRVKPRLVSASDDNEPPPSDNTAAYTPPRSPKPDSRPTSARPDSRPSSAFSSRRSSAHRPVDILNEVSRRNIRGSSRPSSTMSTRSLHSADDSADYRQRRMQFDQPLEVGSSPHSSVAIYFA